MNATIRAAATNAAHNASIDDLRAWAVALHGDECYTWEDANLRLHAAYVANNADARNLENRVAIRALASLSPL